MNCRSLSVDDEDVRTCVDDLMGSLARHAPHLPLDQLPQSSEQAESMRQRVIHVRFFIARCCTECC